MPSRSEREAKKKKRQRLSNPQTIPKQTVESVPETPQPILSQDNPKPETLLPPEASEDKLSQLSKHNAVWGVIGLIGSAIAPFLPMAWSAFAFCFSLVCISIAIYRSPRLKDKSRTFRVIIKTAPIALLGTIFFLLWLFLQPAPKEEITLAQIQTVVEKAVGNKASNTPTPTINLEDKKLISGFEGNTEWFAMGEVTYEGKKYTAITCLVTIKNLGMPSAATDWHLVVNIRGEKPFWVKPQHIFNELTLFRDDKNAPVISDKDYIYERTLKPIAQGEIINGYLHFWIRRDKEKVNVSGTTMEIRYSDITRKQYRILLDIFPYKTDDYQIPYIPGLQFKEKPLKKATQK